MLTNLYRKHPFWRHLEAIYSAPDTNKFRSLFFAVVDNSKLVLAFRKAREYLDSDLETM